MIKKILLLLFLLPSLVLGAGWHDASPYPAFPATNVNWFAGTVTSGTVSRASGSTSVTPSSTGWSFSYSNFPYTSLHFFSPTNGLYGLVAERTNVWVKTATSLANPASCSDFVIITNSVVVLETNRAMVVACLADPMTNSYVWANGSTPLDCSVGKTNVPQLIAWSYTPLTNPVNGSKFLLITNWNMNAPQIWPGDTTWAANEREDVLGVSSNSWLRQVLQPDDPLQSAAIYQSLPIAKAWVLSNAYSFVISAFTNTAGTFDTYCAAPQTGMVWATGQSGLCSDPVMDANGYWYCGSPLYNTTNQWTNSISYRPPPQWSDTFYLTADGSNITSVAPYQFAPALDITGKLCAILHLPCQRIPVIVTNTGTFDGYRLGFPLVYTTNAIQVATNFVTVADYFSRTPDKHHMNYDTGLKHVNTNRWTFGPEHFPTWTKNSSLDAVSTNGLQVLGDTRLSLSAPYWSNGWKSVDIVASYSVLYTLQITGFTNGVTSNGGVTNVFTNTTSAIVNVYRLDYDSRVFSNPAVAFSTNLLGSITLTGTNSVTITALLTNWAVADGYTEQAYDWDGVRTCLNALTKIAGAIGWRNTDGVLTNRYGTNWVHDIADTNLFGSLRPTSVITDTLANASASIHFTNLNYSANVPPWGASYATTTNTEFRKDTWQGSILQSSWPDDGSVVVYTCNSYTVGMVIPGVYGICTCDSYSTNILTCDNVSEVVDLANAALEKEVAAVSAATGGFGSPSYVYITLQDNPANAGCDYCNSPWGMALGKFDLHDCGLTNDGTFYMTNNFCGTGYPAVLPTELPADYPSPPCALPVLCPTPSSYVFWHGSSPSNFSFCCEQDSVFYSGSASWTNVGAFTDSGTIAYSVGTPTATNVLAVYLYQPQQTSAGVNADISKSWACGRDVYLIPNLPTIAGWINTNILPVAASINSNATVLVTWTNTPTGDCTNKFAESMPQQWTYDAKVGFYQTGNSSNVTQVVTNFQWATTAVWKQPSVWTGPVWDSTNNVGFYRRFSTATAQTNLFGLLDFLSTTPLITNVEDSTPYGWGVGIGILIENWSVSNGVPHR